MLHEGRPLQQGTESDKALFQAKKQCRAMYLALSQKASLCSLSHCCVAQWELRQARSPTISSIFKFKEFKKKIKEREEILWVS